MANCIDKTLCDGSGRCSVTITDVNGFPIESRYLHDGDEIYLNVSEMVGYTFVDFTYYDYTTHQSYPVIYEEVNGRYKVEARCGGRYIANFRINIYTVIAEPNNAQYGYTSGSGNYRYNETRTVEAFENSGYRFIGWYINNVLVSSEIVYSFVLTEDVHIIAVFEGDAYVIISKPNNPMLGSTTGTGSYEFNDIAHLTATPFEGSYFIDWTDGNYSDDRNETVTGNKIYVANFERYTYTVNVVIINNSTTRPSEVPGIVMGEGTYQYGETVTLFQSPNEGFAFVKWTHQGTDSTDASGYTFTVTSNTTIYIVYEDAMYTLTLHCSPINRGITTRYPNTNLYTGGTYPYGEVIDVKAIPNPGNVFNKWSDNTLADQRTFVMNHNITQTAYFNMDLETFTLTVIFDSNKADVTIFMGGTNITTYGSGFAYATVDAGTELVVVVNGHPYYAFIGWDDGNYPTTRNFMMDNNYTVEVLFSELEKHNVCVCSGFDFTHARIRIYDSAYALLATIDDADDLCAEIDHGTQIIVSMDVFDSSYAFYSWDLSGLSGVTYHITTNNEIVIDALLNDIQICGDTVDNSRRICLCSSFDFAVGYVEVYVGGTLVKTLSSSSDRCYNAMIGDIVLFKPVLLSPDYSFNTWDVSGLNGNSYTINNNNIIITVTENGELCTEFVDERVSLCVCNTFDFTTATVYFYKGGVCVKTITDASDACYTFHKNDVVTVEVSDFDSQHEFGTWDMSGMGGNTYTTNGNVATVTMVQNGTICASVGSNQVTISLCTGWFGNQGGLLNCSLAYIEIWQSGTLLTTFGGSNHCQSSYRSYTVPRNSIITVKVIQSNNYYGVDDWHTATFSDMTYSISGDNQELTVVMSRDLEVCPTLTNIKVNFCICYTYVDEPFDFTYAHFKIWDQTKTTLLKEVTSDTTNCVLALDKNTVVNVEIILTDPTQYMLESWDFSNFTYNGITYTENGLWVENIVLSTTCQLCASISSCAVGFVFHGSGTTVNINNHTVTTNSRIGVDNNNTPFTVTTSTGHYLTDVIDQTTMNAPAGTNQWCYVMFPLVYQDAYGVDRAYYYYPESVDTPLSGTVDSQYTEFYYPPAFIDPVSPIEYAKRLVYWYYKWNNVSNMYTEVTYQYDVSLDQWFDPTSVTWTTSNTFDTIVPSTYNGDYIRVLHRIYAKAKRDSITYGGTTIGDNNIGVRMDHTPKDVYGSVFWSEIYGSNFYSSRQYPFSDCIIPIVDEGSDNSPIVYNYKGYDGCAYKMHEQCTYQAECGHTYEVSTMGVGYTKPTYIYQSINLHTIGNASSGADVNSLPTPHTRYNSYEVLTAGTYAGVYCNVGDIIVCKTDGTTANNSDWDVVTPLQMHTISTNYNDFTIFNYDYKAVNEHNNGYKIVRASINTGLDMYIIPNNCNC